MGWLFLLVLILQAFFHWILNPFIVASTGFFELRSLGILILFLLVWLFSGKDTFKISKGSR